MAAEGRRIGMTHGHRGPGRSTPERALGTFRGRLVECVVFGHSHIPYAQVHDGVLAFNPGSPTTRRRGGTLAYGILFVGPGGIRAELHELDT